MTRTPDEIKKGLLCCGAGNHCRGYCPYDGRSASIEGCTSRLSRDALALIQQLESDKQQLEGMLTHMNQLRDAAAGRALKMEERAHQLEAERDAALEDKRGECTYCAYLPGETIPQTCFDCANKGFYRWEWRGVQKEDGNA